MKTLTPDKILLELMPSDGEQFGQYRTVSSHVAVTRMRLNMGDRAMAQVWATRGLNMPDMQNPGDVATLYPSQIDKAPITDHIEGLIEKWLTKLGLGEAAKEGSMSSLLCRGAPYHTDIDGFSDNVFMVLWLGTEPGLELGLPALGRRIPLLPGTCVIFDSAQPHGVLRAGKAEYRPDDLQGIPPQAFVTLDMPAAHDAVVKVMGLALQESAEGWEGLMIPITDGGPKVDDFTGTLIPWQYQAEQMAASI